MNHTLHVLIERIQVHLDRKAEVKLRTGEKIERAGGGQTLDLHESKDPISAMFQIRVSNF